VVFIYGSQPAEYTGVDGFFDVGVEHVVVVFWLLDLRQFDCQAIG
jgi:hypothetical protein